jgi:hypothetical protein
MKKIAFHNHNLCFRGASNAMYAYADHNEKVLGNKSVIMTSPSFDLSAYDKFKNRFGEIHQLHSWEWDEFLLKESFDAIYLIKFGIKGDGLLTTVIPCYVHTIFRVNEPHGDKYCYVSDWLAKDQGYDPTTRSVPHIVEKAPKPKYDLRNKLGIDKNKTVFACYGGSTEFNISFVQEQIYKTVNERDDIVFLFMNIDKFCDNHKNIIHIGPTWDLEEKSAFVHAADAMIHARSGGETFGCAVAEFSIENKPVITYSESGERSHLEILGDRGIYYKNPDEVYDIFNNLNKYIKHDDYYKAYDNYSPEFIMQRFKKNFLD